MATILHKKIIFPLLFGLYPVISLLAHNANEIELVFALRPLILTFILVSFLFWVSRWAIRDRHRAAILVSVFVILFFSYGHLYLYLNTMFQRLELARIRYLVLLYGLIFLVVLVWVLRSKQNFQKYVYPLNITALAALLLPLTQIGIYVFQVSIANGSGVIESKGFDSIEVTPGEIPPDIYFIVLDGYSRQDVLKQTFEYDNGSFLDAISDRGFYIARCSQSNYSWTSPSLASTFKMGYLNEETGVSRVLVNLNDRRELILHGPVRKLLERLGYTTVAFETGYKWQHWYDADVYLTPCNGGWFDQELFWNEFELMLFETSALRLISDAQFLKNTYANHRQRILNALDSLETIPADIPGPKFVYAHVIAPHAPYVFGPEGEWLDSPSENQITGYCDQVDYVSTRVLQIVDIILEQSQVQPVIIIQGDHGASINWERHGLPPEYKLAILNAYYLPGVDAEAFLYENITPVNTFRLIFDIYFNSELGLLEDLSFFDRQSPSIQLPCR